MFIKNLNKLAIIGIVIAGFIIGFDYFWSIPEKNDRDSSAFTSKPLSDQIRECMPKSDLGSRNKCQELLSSIQEFYQCVQAGFPIMKSNPPQCETPDGRRFTEKFSKVSTLSGIHVCLPHRNNSGPQTLECALGLMTPEGLYYALDMSVLQTAGFVYPTGTTLKVNGFLVPIEQISTNIWDKYNIRGIMKVTDAEEI